MARSGPLKKPRAALGGAGLLYCVTRQCRLASRGASPRVQEVRGDNARFYKTESKPDIRQISLLLLRLLPASLDKRQGYH